jgi:outer membrane protein W
MDETKQRLEANVIKSLQAIKISVGDEQPAPVPAPMATTEVKDTVTNHSAAPAPAPTMAPQTSAPGAMNDQAAPADATSTIAKEDVDGSSDLKGRFSIFPLGGITSINSNSYNVDARYTAGVGIEAEVSDNISVVGSYSYSQFNVGLANANPYYNYYQGTSLVNSNNLNALQYNQNVIDAGLRFYLLPKSSRFRAYIGAGAGYSKGYLNYNQNSASAYANNAYAAAYGQTTSDYQVSQILGQLTTGAEVQVSKSVSIGADFKYDAILSSNQNDPLNNNAFVNNGYNYVASNQQSIAGGSLAKDSFYSLTANVKFTF